MKICIIRHGETDWNTIGKLQGREDIPINDSGIEQIKSTLDYLRKYNWHIIITSPLLRAKMSAEIIAKGINTEIREEMDFIERDYGKASGMTLDERETNFPNGKWPGIESIESLQKRTVAALLKYIKEYSGYNIIIISHGLAIDSILSFLSNHEIGVEKTSLRNGSITLLEKNEDRINILFFNKVASEITDNTT